MNKTILLISLIGILCSCASPLDNKYSGDVTEKDINEIKAELDSTELMLLVGSVIGLQMTGEKVEEMTYREILENGKKLKAQQEFIAIEQKAFAEKAKNEARIKKLTKKVMVTCFEKSFAKNNDHDHINYRFIIQNKSNKGILALKGDILFTDQSDNEIKSLSFVYNQPIEAGKKVSWNAQTDYTQHIDEDVAFKNKALEDLKVVWKPEKIIFDDGTTLN